MHARTLSITSPQKENHSGTRNYWNVYDGWNLLAEISQPAAGSHTTNYYVWGSDLSGSLQGAGGIGGLLAQVVALATEDTVLYTYDGNGNVCDIVDGNGSLKAHYDYDPFWGLPKERDP